MEFGIPPYLEAPPDDVPPPPTVTREQLLPFHALAWENFERLCLRLVRRDAQIYQCYLYGDRGQNQRGIDIIAYRGDLPHREFGVYQCKREEEFGAAKIGKAVDKFVESQWDPYPSTFTICSSKSLRSTTCQDEILKQTQRLAERNINLDVWDAETLSEMLKRHPDLVDDFFNRPWVVAFNGDGAAKQLAERLSGQEIVTLRRNLFTVYRTLFERHDPGLARSLLERPVPFLDRYVPSDIAEHRAVTITAPRESEADSPRLSDRVEEILAGSGIEGLSTRREHPISQQEFTIEKREPVLQWLPKGSRAVVLGEPGSGKSALLRFIALSLLNPTCIDPHLAPVWGERLPIWISFSAWTRAVAENDSVNLQDFLFTWLHQHSADELCGLISQALKDRRLLLLIDGLDERYNDQAGKVALDRLEAFLSVRNIPAVLTARPAGYEKLRRPSGEWRHGRLLELNDLQLRCIAKFWFSWLGSSTDNSSSDELALRRAAERQTEQFIEQLDAAPRIRDLARVPLLLLLFIEVIKSKGRIPEHRIKAYDMMVEFLIAVHPALRHQAAGLTKTDHEELAPDEIKEAMARLALRIQESHGGGYAPVEICREVFIQYLGDPVDGLGYEMPEARKRATHLIRMAQEGLGLLVERGVDEPGFIYLTLQEYLAALAIARLPEANQQKVIELHWKDSRWREVIIALLGITGLIRRDRSRLEKLVEHLRTQPQSELQRWNLWPVLSEIVFGELGLSPVRAGALATEIMDIVEQGPFVALRKQLVPMVVRGLRSDYLRESVKNRLQTWFPARLNYTRRDLLLGTLGWEPAEDLKTTLLIAINDEDAACRNAAAKSLAAVFKNDSQILAQLSFNVRSAIRPDLREASILALSEGWPQLDALPKLLESFLDDCYPGIRLNAALGRLSLGQNNNKDLNVLWDLLKWRSGLDYWRRDEVIPAIVKGWPQSTKIRDVCLKILAEHRHYSGEEVNTSDAATILITMFSGDDDVAQALAKLIRSSDGISFSHSHAVWPLIAQNYRKHPLLVESVSQYLERRRQRYEAIYIGPEETSAVTVAGTPELKAELIALFDEKKYGHVRQYWIAAALVDAWPDDEEVREFLRTRLDGAPEIAGEVAPFIERLGYDSAEQRKRLLSVVLNPETPRIWIAFDTLLRINTPDEEILQAGLSALKRPRHFYDDHNLKRSLIESFPRDQRVEILAWELWNEVDSSPGFLANLFGSHTRFRPVLLAAMRPLDTAARNQLVAELGASYIPSVHAASLLRAFVHEQENPSVRTLAAINLASHTRHDSKAADDLIKTFSGEAESVGQIYEMRRSSALGGLLRLGRLDVIQSLKDSSVHIYSHRPNLPYFSEILRHWNALKLSFGAEIFKRFGNSESEFWEIAAPLVHEFDDAKQEFVAYLKTIAGKAVAPNTLDAMAELFPKSDTLRVTCLETLQSSNFPLDATAVAARLIGQHFPGDADILERLRNLEEMKYGPRPFERFTPWRTLLALCYGWMDAAEVKDWIKKPRAEWKGMPWHIALHLDRIGQTPDAFLKDIEVILERSQNTAELHDFEINDALNLWATDENNRAKLIPLIDSLNSSLAITAIALLSDSGPITDSLRTSFETLFNKEVKAETDPPRTGLDLSSGSLRVMAEVIFEAIQ